MNTPVAKGTFCNLTKCFVAKTEVLHENQFHCAALNDNQFENSFQYFELERQNSNVFKNKSENSQTLIKFKEFKTNEKVGTSEQKQAFSIQLSIPNLGNFDFATTNELEYISKLKNKQINVNTTEDSEDISKPYKDKKQNQKSTKFYFHSLKSMLHDLTALRIDNDKKKLIHSDSIIQIQSPFQMSKLRKNRCTKM